MIVLHQFEISPYCDKVRRALHLKGLDYEKREWPPSELAGLGKINRIRKLPVLDHDGTLVPDSSDIVRYLDARFPDPLLVPEEPEARAKVTILEDWADESLYYYALYFRWVIPKNAKQFARRLVASETNPVLRAVLQSVVPRTIAGQAKRQGLGKKDQATIERELGTLLEALDGWLGDDDWLVGDEPTLADVAVAAQLSAIEDTEDGARVLDAGPGNVRGWLERVDRRTLER